MVSDSSESAAIAAELKELGGAPETHDLDDSAVAEVDAAAAAEAPADASATDDSDAPTPAGTTAS